MMVPAFLGVLVGGCLELGSPDMRARGTGGGGSSATDAGGGGGGAGGRPPGDARADRAQEDGSTPQSDASSPDGDGAPDDAVTPDGAETVLLPAGMACTTGAECATAFCIDGVCCQSACESACHSCKQPGSLGICAPAALGESDPRGMCAADEATSCKRDGTCDGNGACRMHAAGTVCAAQACSAGTESSSRTCDGLGTCRPATTKMCDPFLCAGAACAISCTAKGDCIDSSFCNGGKCSGLLAAGSACTAATQCLSGFCSDGVCCQTSCTGTCSACNLPGSLGSCAPVPDGEDPGSDCATDAASSCDRDGTCDGRGACRLYAAGTVCAAPSCSGSTEKSSRTCNGTGTCRTAATKSCAPYMCGGAGCATSCANAADCQSSHYCDAGACKPKLANAQACLSAAQCGTGNCTDGVCCDAACGGTCQACNLPGNVGKCTPVPSGEDPADECTMEATATCGRDGTCDGTGACGLFVVGTICVAGSCTADVESSPRICDGGGVCQAPITKSCAPFSCNGAVCASGCVNDGECSAGQYCAAGACTQKLANGDTCGGANVCASGFCVNGVCCNGACTDSCSACNLAGSLGTCSARAATLLARWKLDETSGTTATDSSCNGLAGTLREYATPDWRTPGKVGGALGFDGVSNWVRVPDTADKLDAIASANRFTFMAWVNKTAASAGFSNVLSRQAMTGAGEHYGFGFTDNKPFLLLKTQAGGPWCVGSGAVSFGVWNHLAATWDGTTTRVYLNGVQVCTAAAALTLGTDTTPLIIGGNSNSSTDDAQELFKGLIDDVVVYSRALSASEVAAVAAGGSPP